jgi:hypothetical protein
MMFSDLFRLFSFGLFLPFIFVGCGKFDRASGPGTTTVSFSAQQSATASVINGGLLVYAYSNNFTTNIRLNNESGGGSITLPNGSYSFYALGYATSFGSEFSDNEDNQPFCAVVGEGSPIVLNGTPIAVSLQLRRQNCELGAFTGGGAFTSAISSTSTGASTTFPMLNLVHCAAGVNIPSYTIAGTSCGWTSTVMWPAVSRYQVSLPTYRFENGAFLKTGEGFRSPCSNSFPSSGGMSAFSEYKRVPLGITSRPYLFPVEIETFSDTACSNSIAVHRFHRGLALAFGPTAAASNLASLVFGGSPNKTWFYLRQP